MRDIRKELRPFMVTAGCDACNHGVMEVMGVTLLSNPAQWPHECNYCGHRENFPKAYPCIEHEEIKYA